MTPKAARGNSLWTRPPPPPARDDGQHEASVVKMNSGEKNDRVAEAEGLASPPGEHSP